MSLLIKPSLLTGKITIPPSKSLSHRAIICASLCMEGQSKIQNIIFSDDIKATIEGMKVLGAGILEEESCIIIKRRNIILNNIIHCNESGSTLRFLIPLSMILTDECVFTGNGRLLQRPLDVYYDVFRKSNIKYKINTKENYLRIRGSLQSSCYEIPGNISSQFITGLLFALPMLEGESLIKITGALESKNYIDLTLDILKRYNIYIEKIDEINYFIKGNQKYKAHDYTVEGDFSQAAFFLVANELGSSIECHGLNYNSLQGDKRILDIIQQYSLNPKEIIIDSSQIPDIVPIITVIAALKENCTTNIVNAGRLRLKESDRLKAIATEMNKLGAFVKETDDGLLIKGRHSLQGSVTVNSWNDHRIAMALAIAATKCDKPIVLEGHHSVNKSYPKFWYNYHSLGGIINEL